MVGADVGAKDCYGNIPSQIFDDHVTEPVLDEVRVCALFSYCVDAPTYGRVCGRRGGGFWVSFCRMGHASPPLKMVESA